MYGRGEELTKVVAPKAVQPGRSDFLNLISRHDAAVCSCLVYPSLGLSVRNSVYGEKKTSDVIIIMEKNRFFVSRKSMFII